MSDSLLSLERVSILVHSGKAPNCFKSRSAAALKFRLSVSLQIGRKENAGRCPTVGWLSVSTDGRDATLSEGHIVLVEFSNREQGCGTRSQHGGRVTDER
jgi:hypothetical protein